MDLNMLFDFIKSYGLTSVFCIIMLFILYKVLMWFMNREDKEDTKK